ncbi:MAG: DNA methyltransferase [Nitrospiraceae bacterium]|nr:MAG: DNA methyltransferase [Nitrospiraceae bacterium]
MKDCPSVEDIDEFVLESIARPSRILAPVRWFGGKGNLAKWILRYWPRGRFKLYVEPFCGAASVFWHLPDPYPVEVLNDLDGRIVNLFRVLQDEDSFRKLCHRLIWTPYSRAEFRRALAILNDLENRDAITQAWAFFVAMNQGFSGVAKTEGNWSRAFIAHRGMADPTNKWRGRLRLLRYWHDRLTRVQIDSRDAVEVIEYWDSAETLFYLDPPYIHGTRKVTNIYDVEPDDEFHQRLVETLLRIQGAVVLSGYRHPIYEPLEAAGWRRVDKETSCHAACKGRGSPLRGKGNALKHAPRTESLWLSPRAVKGALL